MSLALGLGFAGLWPPIGQMHESYQSRRAERPCTRRLSVVNKDKCALLGTMSRIPVRGLNRGFGPFCGMRRS
jgi:hypothetical protein